MCDVSTWEYVRQRVMAQTDQSLPIVRRWFEFPISTPPRWRAREARVTRLHRNSNKSSGLDLGNVLTRDLFQNPARKSPDAGTLVTITQLCFLSLNSVERSPSPFLDKGVQLRVRVRTRALKGAQVSRLQVVDNVA